MKLTLYNSKAENNKLNKTNQLKKMYTLNNIFLKNETSLIAPVFRVSKIDNIDELNYCFFDGFNRYYYINDIRAVANGLFDIYCEVDVLMSFRNDILKLSGIVGRIGQDNRGNFYIPDSEIVTEARDYNIPIASTKKFNNEASFLLTVAGG